MKKQFLSLSLLLITSFLFINCSKSKDGGSAAPSYPSTQGKITGTGDASFSVTGTSAFFVRKVDTISFKATVSTAPGSEKQFIIGMVAKSTGTINFNNSAANLYASYSSGGVAFYEYETINSGGTVISHEFVPGSGTITLTYLSSTAVEGSYTATLKDINNNGDAPVTISGTFSGNF